MCSIAKSTADAETHLCLKVLFIALLFPDPVMAPYVLKVTPWAWPCCILQNVLGLLLGYFISYGCGFDTIYHRTIAFEIGAQQTGLPVAIIQFCFDPEDQGQAAGYLLVYYLTGAVINLSTATLFRYCAPLEKPPEQELKMDQAEPPLDAKVDASVHVKADLHSETELVKPLKVVPGDRKHGTN